MLYRLAVFKPLPCLKIFLVVAVLSLAVPAVSFSSGTATGRERAASVYERSRSLLERNATKALPDYYTFVILGDNRGNDEVFKKTLALARSFSPLLILHLGDVSQKGSATEIDHFLDMVKSTVPDIPFFIVLGNHETDKTLANEKLGPSDYSIEIDRLKMQIVVLDDARYAVSPSQLKYLQARIDRNIRNTFVAMHIPPKTMKWDFHTFSQGAGNFKALLVPGKVTMAFFGHIHMYDEETVNSVPYVISGGAGAELVTSGPTGEPVYHIVVVTVKNGTATYRKVNVPDKP